MIKDRIVSIFLIIIIIILIAFIAFFSYMVVGKGETIESSVEYLKEIAAEHGITIFGGSTENTTEEEVATAETTNTTVVENNTVSTYEISSLKGYEGTGVDYLTTIELLDTIVSDYEDYIVGATTSSSSIVIELSADAEETTSVTGVSSINEFENSIDDGTATFTISFSTNTSGSDVISITRN